MNSQRMKARSLSANRCLPHSSTPGSAVILSCVDLRSTSQKIEDLKNESPEENLQNLLLMQVYINLEYGDVSIENARAYLNLSKYYYHRKKTFLPQAKFHALSARDILEQLQIQPNDDHFRENILAYEIYLMLLQCSLNAKQRELKSKNKYILSMDKSHIKHDLKLAGKYLEKLKNLLKKNEYEKLYIEYLFIKFEIIIINSKEFNKSILEVIDQIINYLNEKNRSKIDFYQRCGLYLIHFQDYIPDGLMYLRKSVEFAEEEEKTIPSIDHKYQLANAILQRSIAKVRTDRLTDDLEKEFQRAIYFYKQPTGEINKNTLKAIDELATYYLKIEKYQV